MINNIDISKLRRSYSLKELSENLVSADPFSQFSLWMNEAMNSKLLDPHAMTLATTTKDGIPSARIVLLRGFDKNGFVFYTNYESSKAKDLMANPNASLLFFWVELERQVRISGKVKKVSQEESEKYFNSRPRENQLGAWASKQSSVIINREVLEKQFEELKIRFENQKIPLPKFWGGYTVIPYKMEFWQGRENRLHDRICYILDSGHWKIERLAP
jgi:pyridoxamine 5'-phosphate oxidase